MHRHTAAGASPSPLRLPHLSRPQFEADPASPSLKDNAHLLYQTCLLESGFELEDMKEFNARVFKLLGREMNVADLTVTREAEGAGAGG